MKTPRVISTSNAIKSADKSIKLLTLEIMLRDKLALEQFNVKTMIRNVYDDINERSIFRRSGVERVNAIKLVVVSHLDKETNTRMPLFTQDSYRNFIQSSLDAGRDILDFRKFPEKSRDQLYQVVNSMVQELDKL